jgi:hypothetical protein
MSPRESPVVKPVVYVKHRNIFTAQLRKNTTADLKQSWDRRYFEPVYETMPNPISERSSISNCQSRRE